MTDATDRFKAGDIIRYGSGISALFRYDGTHNSGRLYGSHVLGGVHGAADVNFFKLQTASAEDIEFCRQKRPEWFSPAAVSGGKGWAVWHPTKGFDAYQYEGAIAYADLNDDLLEDVADLNDTDGTDKITGWRIVPVKLVIADGEPK